MTESQELRSRIMAAVKSRDTGPELIVRRLAHRMGYRFSLRRADLPGKPDLVFPKLRKAIFVHGCFWHGHNCPRGARVPKRNRNYWLRKVARNKLRDRKNLRALKIGGWNSLVIWECSLQNLGSVEGRIDQFLAG
jgi:DNA mismatch endonuclease (patch repair protein)